MSKDLSWRPGGGKHDIAHRAWRQPDLTLDVDTRKTHCHKCLRPVRHPIHARVFRERKDWFGWKYGGQEVKKYQLCVRCDGHTGRTTGEDSIYVGEVGPLCEECRDIEEAEAEEAKR